MNSLICRVIREMKLLEFYYDGYYRKVEPHTYGISGNRNEMLLAYQIKGSNKKGIVPGWKQFILDKIEKINILNETFKEPRPDYVKDDKKIKTIYCEL